MPAYACKIELIMIDNISQFFLQASYLDCLYVASYRNKPLGLVL